MIHKFNIQFDQKDFISTYMTAIQAQTKITMDLKVCRKTHRFRILQLQFLKAWTAIVLVMAVNISSKTMFSTQNCYDMLQRKQKSDAWCKELTRSYLQS